MAKKFNTLRAKMSSKRLAANEAAARKMLAERPLQELRHARELSQQALADSMEVSQSEISRLEKRTDTYISTLRSYIEAMGGRLYIIAEFPEGEYRINQFEELACAL